MASLVNSKLLIVVVLVVCFFHFHQFVAGKKSNIREVQIKDGDEIFAENIEENDLMNETTNNIEGNSHNTETTEKVKNILTPEEEEEKNTKIKEKYKAMSELMSEILPGIDGDNQTASYFRFLEKFKQKNRRRMEKQKNCKRNRHTVLEDWLSKQLSTVQARAMRKTKKQCQTKNNSSRTKGDDVNYFKGRFKRDSEDDDDDSDDLNQDENKIKSKRRNIISRFCNKKGELDDDGTFKLCTECYVQHDLGPRKYPRYLNEIECGNSWPNDFFCLSNEGFCAPKNILITFRYDKDNQGHSKLYEWQEYLQPINVGCSCQIVENSIFRYFL